MLENRVLAGKRSIDHGLLKACVEEFIAWGLELVKACVVTQHRVSNILIHLEKDSARVETYVNAWHRIEGPLQTALAHQKTRPYSRERTREVCGILPRISLYRSHGEARRYLRISRPQGCSGFGIGLPKGQEWSDYPYAGELQHGTP